MRKLNYGDLLLNEPVQWDCFDNTGALVLEKGVSIADQQQLGRLIEQGLFAAQPAIPSPFRLMEDIELRLRMLFSTHAATRSPGFPERIVKICQDLQSMCEIDADAALGMLHLNNESRYTIIHPLHVAILCELIAMRKGIAAESRLSILAAALTSNIAMIELQETLQKQVSPLTAEQSEKIRMHPIEAARMLRDAGVQDEAWISAVQNHHERLDGKGYPGALKGKDISLPVRILALADTYGALISPRSYRAAKFSHESLRETFLKRGTAMDKSLPQLFVEELGMFPPGVFVDLQNGEIAVVVRRGAGSEPPQVQSIVSRNGTPYPEPVLREAGQEGYAIRGMVPPSTGFAINRPLLWGYME